MTQHSFLNDLFGVLSPGRRKLHHRQRARIDQTLRLQGRLLGEYKSLAELPTRVFRCSTLGRFDFAQFGDYIQSTESRESWEDAQQQINTFRLPRMTGGVNPGDQRLIFHLMEFLKPSRVLEIGTHIGASTIHIAAALRKVPNHQFSLTSVDIKDVNCSQTRPWKEFDAEFSPLEMIDRMQCTDTVSFRVRPSVEFLSSDQQDYDVIFLDGDHSARAVYQEIPLSIPKLARGGVVLLHDYFPDLQPLWNGDADQEVLHPDVIPGVFLAVQRLQRETLNFRVTPFGELPWPTKLGSNVTSLALLSAND